jgi:enamine deaminase RidA (YjgF/YER057c/UK114 family)
MTSRTEARLCRLGITLPALPTPGGNYLSARAVGSLVFLAGVISMGPDGVIIGTAGLNRTIEEAYRAARACALTQLSVLRRQLGSLDKIKGVVSVTGYVNAIAGFPDTSRVINGASDLFIKVLGESARHVRAAIGISALPRNAPAELQMTVEIRRP